MVAEMITCLRYYNQSGLNMSHGHILWAGLVLDTMEVFRTHALIVALYQVHITITDHDREF